MKKISIETRVELDVRLYIRTVVDSRFDRE
jgi:hypothetical protein